MVLASLAHSLEEIAPERARLTVGPGYLSVGNIGRPRATVAAMRRAVLTIRRLLRGERVEFNGVETRLRNLSPHPTPVFMTAAGPRMVELAGEVADGALLLVGLHPRAVDTARRRLEIGAARAGRNLNGFQTIFITPTTVSDDGHGARRFPQRWFRPDQPYLKYPSDSNLVWYVGMRQTDPTWVEENRGPAWSSHPILIEPEQLPGPIAPASCKEGPTRKGRRSHRRYRWKENRDS